MEIDGKRSTKEGRRIFHEHISENFGGTVASEGTNVDILDVLTPIARREFPTVHTDNVKAYLRAAFEVRVHAGATTRWSGRKWNFLGSQNPVPNTKKVTKRQPVDRRVLWAEEVSLVLRGEEIWTPSHLALELLIPRSQHVE